MANTLEPRTSEPSSFEKYVDRLEVSRYAQQGSRTRDEIVETIRRVDAAVAVVEGHGFEITPFSPEAELAAAVGLDDSVELWVKNETNNVSGSHKARHLFGVALDEALRPDAGDGPFAIASCGNAALGAAVIANAVDHPLQVFVPEWANEAVVARIEELGGTVVRCAREPGVLGDPAHHGMLAAIAGGAVPFSCQGTETPATIDGGRTIAYEMVDMLIEHDGGRPTRLDRLFVQVGGGALGSAVVTGLARTSSLAALPVVHAVQPEGNHPLVRAWDRLVAELLDREVPAVNRDRSEAAAALGRLDRASLDDVAARIDLDAGRYMAPWDDEPMSYATGILDDVTYDWVPLIDAMLASGGHPIVAPEDEFRDAHRLAHTHTDIAVCPTGSAGLGGLLTFVRERPDAIAAGERVAVLFTGHMRPGDPDPMTN